MKKAQSQYIDQSSSNSSTIRLCMRPRGRFVTSVASASRALSNTLAVLYTCSLSFLSSSFLLSVLCFYHSSHPINMMLGLSWKPWHLREHRIQQHIEFSKLRAIWRRALKQRKINILLLGGCA
ncbi:hypothetical protein BS50DRAFT_394771 [Corynespora cassiicola Philippines]|uniref:Uncharacterized protein n=1 Tax=Corynespora cassiicola Philippines TaxID=1448308 RepID=A0A2T2MZU1_CORCC|nr:hypothetical protein BS50DRAFT_394771 [Corynespora cassiicola Philippines]